MLEAVKELNTKCPEETEQKSNQFEGLGTFWFELVFSRLGGTNRRLPVRERTCAKAQRWKGVPCDGVSARARCLQREQGKSRLERSAGLVVSRWEVNWILFGGQERWGITKETSSLCGIQSCRSSHITVLKSCRNLANNKWTKFTFLWQQVYLQTSILLLAFS